MRARILGVEEYVNHTAKIDLKLGAFLEAIEGLKDQLLADSWQDEITEEEKAMVMKVMLQKEISSAARHSYSKQRLDMLLSLPSIPTDAVDVYRMSEWSPFLHCSCHMPRLFIRFVCPC